MPDYSRRQMRREYAGEMRKIRTLLLSLFGAAVMFIWILYIRKQDHTPADAVFFACLPAALGLFVIGLYMVLTSDQWLLRHTPYGRALISLGNARERMREIDAEAMNAENFPDAVPLDHWLIVYLTPAESREPGRICARPIQREKIEKIVFSQGTGKCVWMTVYLKDQEPARVLLRDQEEIRAMMQWIRTQEMASAWSN